VDPVTARASTITAGLSPHRRGSVALIHDERLVFSIEFQKRDTDPFDLEIVPRVLAGEGYDVEDVDEWVVDGPCTEPGGGLRVGKLELGGWTRPFTSYAHLAGHLAAAYCTSPFARRREPCVVLVWDERCAPRLYRVGADGVVLPDGVSRLPAGQITADRVVRQIRVGTGGGPVNLCVTGDRALDATWNSALRADPMVREIWVPPFADGSGSAIGAAAIHHFRPHGLRSLHWRVGSGSELIRHAHLPDGWSVAPCRPEELARLLHRTGAPATVLSGRAKLGPRALGTRSILAPATDPAIWVRLNRSTGDVGALCLAEHAPNVFDPGTADPYQTFVHRVRPEWAARIPAVMGAGGTTRLQTVGPGDDATLTTILREYHRWSGVPVLCSTEAGGCPDVRAALRGSEVDMVWSDGVLHRRSARGATQPPPDERMTSR
jgi:hypothetical protein